MTDIKIAVLSDIHSNYHAFKACFDDAIANGCDRFIFLGDYVSDLAEPERTMDLLYEIRSRYPTICLRGNRERYMLEGSHSFVPGSKSGSLLFTYEHLRPKDLAFFQSLPISNEVTFAGVTFEIAHAAMEDDRFYFEGDDDKIGTVFHGMQHPFLLTGHSHRQYIRTRSCKTILNPGSVGIPQGGGIWPKYAILHIADGEASFELQKVRYDLEEAIRSQFRSGLVDRARYWAIGVLHDLITGQEWVLKLLSQVEASGNVHDEAAWHAAAVQLGMYLTEEEIIAFYRKIATPLNRTGSQ